MSRPQEGVRAAQQLHRRSACSSACAPGCAAGKWGGYPANLGMGLATFDIMAQLLAHPLTDAAHVWTTRWKTDSTPAPYPGASNMDALMARTPSRALLAAAQQALLPSRSHRGLAPCSMPASLPQTRPPAGSLQAARQPLWPAALQAMSLPNPFFGNSGKCCACDHFA